MCVFYVSRSERLNVRVVAAHVDKSDAGKRRNPKKVAFYCAVEHKHWTPVAVLAMRAVSGLLYIPMIYAS